MNANFAAAAGFAELVVNEVKQRRMEKKAYNAVFAGTLQEIMEKEQGFGGSGTMN